MFFILGDILKTKSLHKKNGCYPSEKIKSLKALNGKRPDRKAFNHFLSGLFLYMEFTYLL